MIDLSLFSRYHVHPDGRITNAKGRDLPESRTLRLVDDNQVRRLVTRKRLIYSRLFGNLEPGDVVVGEFPNYQLRTVSGRDIDDVTIEAIKRRKEKGYPASVTARDLLVDIKLVEKYYGKTK
jgi:hypothetical protein